MTTFSQNLKKYRKLRKMTQQQVANELGLERSSYTAYETGKNEPCLSTLLRISEVFQVSVDELLKESEHKIEWLAKAGQGKQLSRTAFKKPSTRTIFLDPEKEYLEIKE